MISCGLVLPRNLPRLSSLGEDIARRLPSFLPGWRLLLAGTVLAVGLVTYTTQATPAQYVAETLVVMAPVQTDVQFERTIKSFTDIGVTTQALEHHQALVDLVMTPRVEQDVRERLQDQLSASERKPGVLLGRIRAQLLPRSDVISIKAQMDVPTDALAVANAWAQGYVAEVNAVYGSDQSLTALQAELESARARRDEAGAALTAELRSSHLDALKGKINFDRGQIDLLLTPAEFGSSVQSSSYETLQFTTLNELAQTARRLETSRQAAQILLDSSDAGHGIVDAATLALLEAQMVTLSDQVAGPQLQLKTDPVADATSALRDLVERIDVAIVGMQPRLEAERVQFEVSRQVRIDQLEGELRSLRSAYEAELAIRTQLTTQRDLADTTYQALARKVDERRIAQTSLQREVEVASPAFASVRLPRPWRDQLGFAVLVGLAFVVLCSIVKGIVRLDRPGLTPAPAFPSH